MMLNKNTILDLWAALGDIPTSITSNTKGLRTIEEPFLGWPAGTDVEVIWHFFDEQAADFGGVAALMYGDVQPERKFTVDTPVGVIEVYAKHEKDSPADYPGVYVDYRFNDSQLTGEEIGDLVAVVEYDSSQECLQTVTYLPGVDEPVLIQPYRNDGESGDFAMEDGKNITYAEFNRRYEAQIDMLDVYDENGEVIEDDIEIPDDAIVTAVARRGGFFDITVKLPDPAKLPERISIYDVRRGLTDGVIVLGMTDDTVVAEIGEHWFYFGGEKCEGITPSVYADTTDWEETVEDIHSALNAEPINGPTEDDSTECLYYKAVLEEAFAAADASFKGKEAEYPIEEQITACYAYLNWGDRKDPRSMTEEDLSAAEKELTDCVPGFAWVKHAGIAQMVPQDKQTGNLILS